MSEPGFQATVPQPPAAAIPAQEHRLPIRFTGSGSEYFRIWIVNLLLMLVTLSLYYPWAKVRRLRYFYGNTLVGEHPLGFHADPRRMLRGYLLVALLLALYSAAGHFSPTAGLFAFLIVAAVWPALLKASLQFRLANTSWRGLRFRFRGDVRGAYLALLPFFVPGMLMVGALALVPDPEHPPIWFAAVPLLAVFATLGFIPWWWWRLKKYQHDHYAYGPEQSRLHTGTGSFYGVFAETLGVATAASIVVMIVVGIVVAIAVFAATQVRGGRSLAIGLAIVGFVIGMLLMQLVPKPYFTAKMQNLLWSKTASGAAGFTSALRFWPLFGLTLKNWLLMICTLGLYWPFAAVAMQRLRAESVQLVLQVDPQTLADEGRALAGDAAGDAAGDLFGLDIGF
jgi:uncharacterized membrane protein YjgN (DUF898 family)